MTVRVPVRLSGRRDRLSVWLLLGEQRQAFNRGVGLCLEAVESGIRVPSKFDLHKQLTADRASGRMPDEVPVALQRPGIETGRDAVVKWDKARGRLERGVVFWAVRLAAAELDAAGEHRSAVVVRGAGLRRRKRTGPEGNQPNRTSGYRDPHKQTANTRYKPPVLPVAMPAPPLDQEHCGICRCSKVGSSGCWFLLHAIVVADIGLRWSLTRQGRRREQIRIPGRAAPEVRLR